MNLSMHLAGPVALALFAPVTATAQSVLVVDDTPGPGVDFNDIQPAIDAAGPFDRIEVRYGQYSPFVASGQISLIGEDPSSGSVYVSQGSITGVLAGQTAVLVDIDVSNLSVSDCSGSVLLDGVESQTVSVSRCADTRLQSFRGFGTFTRIRKLDVEDAFVQATDLFIEPLISGTDEHGFDAITCTRSTLYLTDCDVEGGEGGNQGLCFGGIVPDGGHALSLNDSNVRLLGTELEGGGPGFDCFGAPSGLRGSAIEFLDGLSEVVESESTLTFGTTGPGSVVSQPGLPWLTLDGDAAPGTIAYFDFYAAPGTSLRAFLGRRPVINPVAGLAVPLLHSAERGVSLGATPSNGRRSLPFTVPTLLRGTLIHLQSSRTLTGGATELSNGVTLVVR